MNTTRVSVDYIESEPYHYEVSVANGGEFEGWQMFYRTLEEAVRTAKDYAKYRGMGACEVWVYDGTIYDKNGKKIMPSNR